MARRPPRSTRPRAVCPGCSRSIAVTFNSTPTATLRGHVKAPREPCPWSGRAVSRSLLT